MPQASTIRKTGLSLTRQTLYNKIKEIQMRTEKILERVSLLPCHSYELFICQIYTAAKELDPTMTIEEIVAIANKYWVQK